MISVSEEYDAYIIVSFVNATLVLSIGETVEEVTDSGFLGTTPTLSCFALGEDALVQVRTLIKRKLFFHLSSTRYLRHLVHHVTVAIKCKNNVWLLHRWNTYDFNNKVFLVSRPRQYFENLIN